MARVADSNVPTVFCVGVWRGACAEFDLAQFTLETRLQDAQVFPDAGGCYSTGQIAQAIYGSLFGERLRRTKEEADQTGLKNAILRREYLPAAELSKTLGEVARAMTQIVRGSEPPRRGQGPASYR